ncbi:MAG: hypothetical protein RLZZ299_1314 [Pseudomonadota bacterium]
MRVTPAQLGVLQIEPTDLCNLACRMCAPHAEGWEQVHGVPKGRLDPDRLDRILARLVEEDCRFDHVILQWLGDPSVHPQLERLVARTGAALRGRIDYLRVDTNGVLLGPDRLRTLLSTRDPHVPLLLVFTLDATTPETYARVKGRDAYALAVRHARALLALRPHHAPGVHVQLQFVVQDGNAHEAGDFLRYWTDAVRCPGRGPAGGHAEILFKRLSVSGGARGQAAADALYDATMARFGIVPTSGDDLSVVTWSERPWQVDDRAGSADSSWGGGLAAPRNAPRAACPAPWWTPVIRHDGSLQACCADLGGTLALGDVADSGFRALWFGDRARALRRAHLEGRFEGACASCGGINWYAMPTDPTAAA